MITLRASGGERYDATIYACKHCKTIGFLIDEDPGVEEIPVPMVDAEHLGTILRFFEHRVECLRDLLNDPSASDEESLDETLMHILVNKSRAFLQPIETQELLQLLMAANYLNCEVLIDLIATVIAARISGKSRDEMRDILGIENDFTEEEEAQIIAENSWAFA